MGHQNPFRFIELDWQVMALGAKPAEAEFGPWADTM